MSRLIDADDIKCAFNDTNITEYGLYPNNIVDLQPTAYNVDKVVEELEELRETYCRLQLSIADGVQIQKLQYSQNAISKAIEIVKAGGTK